MHVSLAGIDNINQIYRSLAAKNLLIKSKDIPEMTIGTMSKALWFFAKGNTIGLFRRIFINAKLSEAEFTWKYLSSFLLDSMEITTILPKNSIVCLDDIERSKVSIASLLSIVINLQENYDSSVVLIFNEEKISPSKRTSLTKHKEKLIWRKYFFEPQIDEIYDNFVTAFTTDKNKAFFDQYKQAILHPFLIYSKNLRVLSRCLRDTDEIFNAKHDLPVEYLKFFSSLFLWMHSEKTLRDLDVYDGTQSYSVALRSGRSNNEEELSDEESESKEFGDIFFDDKWNRGASKSLYNFIKTGFLEKDELLLEFSSTVDDKTAKGLNLTLREQEWFFLTDSELNSLIASILHIFKTDTKSLFGSFFALASHLKKITIHLGQPIPEEFDKLMENIIDRSASRKEDLDHIGLHHDSQEVVDFLNPILSKYKLKLEGEKTKFMIIEMKKSLMAGDEVVTIGSDFNDSNALANALIDDELLSCVLSIADKHPSAFYSFFFRAVKRLEQTNLDNPEKYFNKIQATIYKYVPKDKSSSKRHEYLKNLIDKKMKHFEKTT